jgi:hypothetical protein
VLPSCIARTYALSPERMKRLPWQVLCLLVLGCQGEPPHSGGGLEHEAVLESEHFRYHYEHADPSVCEQTIAQLERHFEALSAYLGGVSPAQGTRIDYYKYPDEAAFAERADCPALALGCSEDFVVRSPTLVHQHELIHAYLRGRGFPPKMFREGMATLLSCERPNANAALLGASVSRQQLVALRSADLVAWPSDLRTIAPHFVAATQLMRSLIDSYGLERTLALYEALNGAESEVEIDAVFHAMLNGVTLAGAWQVALSAEYPLMPCLTPFPCSQQRDFSAGPVSIGSCGIDEDYVAFSLPEPTTLAVLQEGYGDVELRACSEGSGVPDSEFIHWLYTPLGAGDYYFRRYGDRSVAKLSMDSRADTDAPLSTSCESAFAHALTVEADARPVRFSVPAGDATWYMAVDLPDGAALSLRQLSYTTAQVQICPACEAAPEDCQSVGSGQLVHLSERAGLNVVRIQPSAAQGSTLSLVAQALDE